MVAHELGFCSADWGTFSVSLGQGEVVAHSVGKPARGSHGPCSWTGCIRQVEPGGRSRGWDMAHASEGPKARVWAVAVRHIPGYPKSVVAAAAVVAADIRNVAVQGTAAPACNILVGTQAVVAPRAARTRPGSTCRRYRGRAQAAIATAAVGWARACSRPVGHTTRRSRLMHC